LLWERQRQACGAKRILIIFRKRVAGLSEAALERFVKRACRAAGVKGAVDVLVTTSRELQALNDRYRKRNKATDVLSFPPMPGLRGELAGDVAISAEIAKRSARQLGHSVAQEIKILALHGILHLAGYDHENDRGQMARKETQLRTLFSLPNGLIERSAPAENLKDQQGSGLYAADRQARRKSGEARPERSRRGARPTPAP
jgi:probable rRNA maturation factor